VEVTEDWRKLHNEELNDLYSSPNIIRVIKSRRMKSAEHVARVEEMRNAYTFLVGKPEGKRPVRTPGVHGRVYPKVSGARTANVQLSATRCTCIAVL